MKTIQEDCGVCGEEVEKAVMGFVPHLILEEPQEQHIHPSMEELINNFLWGNALVCLNCGAPSLESVKQEDLEEAAQRYVDVLLEYNVMTEEELIEDGLGSYV